MSAKRPRGVLIGTLGIATMVHLACVLLSGCSGCVLKDAPGAETFEKTKVQPDLPVVKSEPKPEAVPVPDLPRPTLRIDAPRTLETSESGSDVTISLTLSDAPLNDVNVLAASSNPHEGVVSPSLVTFTKDNAMTPHWVTVRGMDDAVADGNQTYEITFSATMSSDARFNGLAGAEYTVTNTDNDLAGITAAPQSELVTSEAGGQATFTVVLNSMPTSDVSLEMRSSDTNKGVLSAAQLLFSPRNWNVPQIVSLRGIDDAIADGNTEYRVRFFRTASNDAAYANLSISDIVVTHLDNDVPGVIVTPAQGLQTSTVGGEATFSVRLATMPRFEVSLRFTSSDPTQGRVITENTVFTSANWDRPQTVTIKGVDDNFRDGDKAYSVLVSAENSVDRAYQGLSLPSISLTNIDRLPRYWPRFFNPGLYPGYNPGNNPGYRNPGSTH